MLERRGMPVLHGSGRGDHRILVNVVLPRQLDDAQRKLLEDFADAADDADVRARGAVLPAS